MLKAPAGAGVEVGDLVVGIVRRPDPVPCPAGAVGEWDMCCNSRYTEHGIMGLDGFARERWRRQPDAMVKPDPSLLRATPYGHGSGSAAETSAARRRRRTGPGGSTSSPLGRAWVCQALGRC